MNLKKKFKKKNKRKIKQICRKIKCNLIEKKVQFCQESLESGGFETKITEANVIETDKKRRKGLKK